MKKLIAILLVSVLVLSVFAFTGCKKEEPTLKLGLGVYTTGSASNATADVNGKAQSTVTAAAVLVDNDGKIVKAFIDCADSKVEHTAEGATIATESFKTKYELGAAYGMKAEGYGSSKEWFEHVDAFCALIVGKTASEVKALVASDNKGTQDVISAGCTIEVAEFVKAVEKAMANATASNATKNDALKLGVSTGQTPANATEDKAGSNKVETNLFAAAVNAEGKIVAATSDCVEVTFKFDTAGKVTFDATKEIKTKKEQGDGYGMKAEGYGSSREWYEHAAAFDAACIGKTASEIAGLMGSDYKGNADLQAAGCTIVINGFVKAASKIG